MAHFFNYAKRKILWIITIQILLLLLLCNSSSGMHYYEKTDFVTGIVTATSLNVRSGPGTNFSIITQVNKNEYIRVFAKVAEWYIIQTEDDYIGAAHMAYIKPIYSNSSENQDSKQETQAQKSTIEIGLTEDEKETLDLINRQRLDAGLNVLEIDDEIQNVARVKAKEMVESNYFSHTSPIYGSPFKMLKDFGISYKSAGENIAGNSTNSGAVNAWMNSEGHKANILNDSYNYTGLAVVNSPKYGKIYVQIFIGR